MKSHRVRHVSAVDMTFVEMNEDEWLPLRSIPTHDAIHRFLNKEETDGAWHIRFTTRCFDIIAMLENWESKGVI